MRSSTFNAGLATDFLLLRIQKEWISTFSPTRQISLWIDVAAHLGMCFRTNLCGKFPPRTKEPLNWDMGSQTLNFHLGLKYSVYFVNINSMRLVAAQQFLGTSNPTQSWR